MKLLHADTFLLQNVSSHARFILEISVSFAWIFACTIDSITGLDSEVICLYLLDK